MADNEIERVGAVQDESEAIQEIQILDPEQEELGNLF